MDFKNLIGQLFKLIFKLLIKVFIIVLYGAVRLIELVFGAFAKLLKEHI